MCVSTCLFFLTPKLVFRVQQIACIVVQVGQNRATVLEHIAPRSYIVQTDRGTEIRRNRRDLIKTSEHAVIHPGVTPDITDTERDDEIQQLDPEPYALRTPDVQATVCRRSARMNRGPDRLIENM